MSSTRLFIARNQLKSAVWWKRMVIIGPLMHFFAYQLQRSGTNICMFGFWKYRHLFELKKKVVCVNLRESSALISWFKHVPTSSTRRDCVPFAFDWFFVLRLIYLSHTFSCSYRVLQHAFEMTTNSSVAVRATARRNRHSPRYVVQSHFPALNELVFCRPILVS